MKKYFLNSVLMASIMGSVLVGQITPILAAPAPQPVKPVPQPVVKPVPHKSNSWLSKPPTAIVGTAPDATHPNGTSPGISTGNRTMGGNPQIIPMGNAPSRRNATHPWVDTSMGPRMADDHRLNGANNGEHTSIYLNNW